MTDKEILQMKLNLKESVLDEKEKEEFLTKVEQFTDVFSLRDEIGTCPFIEVHLKLKDETPFFVRPYPMREEQKKVIQKEMDRLEHLGIIHKGLTGYSSPVVLVKRKIQNLYRVCSDFCILNEKLDKINHTFPLVRDCICRAHWDGGSSQGGTKHSLPPVRRQVALTRTINLIPPLRGDGGTQALMA